jgi:hypothetical protein
VKDIDVEAASDSLESELGTDSEQDVQAQAFEPGPDELAPTSRSPAAVMQQGMGNQSLLHRRPRPRRRLGRGDAALLQKTLGNQSLLKQGGAEEPEKPAKTLPSATTVEATAGKESHTPQAAAESTAPSEAEPPKSREDRDEPAAKRDEIAATRKAEPSGKPATAEAAASDEEKASEEKKPSAATKPDATATAAASRAATAEEGGSFAMPAVSTSSPADEGGTGEAGPAGAGVAPEEEAPEEPAPAAAETSETAAESGETVGEGGEAAEGGKPSTEADQAVGRVMHEAPPEESEATEEAGPTETAPMEPGPAAALPADMSGGGEVSAEEPTPVDVAAIAAQPPEAAMASIAGLPPSQAVVAMGAVQASVGSDLTQKRGELSANPPTMERPVGSPHTRLGPTIEPTPNGAPTGAKKVPDRGLAPLPAPVPLPPPGPSPTDAVAAPPVTAATPEGEISAADAAKLEGAVDAVPSRDKELYATAGPAPRVVLEDDANPNKAYEQETEVQAKSAELRTEGARDSAQPMGESDIYPAVPRETLQAKVTPAAGGGGGKAAPAAGMAIDPNIGVLADVEKGDEVRAAAVESQTKLTTAREEHTRTTQEEHRKSDENVRRLVAQNAALQDAERQGARGGSVQLRKEWNTGQQALVSDAGKDLGKERDGLGKSVAGETIKGDENAQREIQTGNDEATQARSEAERKAAEEKSKKPKQGFFGWLASKAKAFFDRIKSAIKGFFDEARKLVRRAIDKAKKLALAAIDKVRQAVVGLIRLAGAAILAIGDRLLVGFPKLRDKFRARVKAMVAGAEKAVNALAERLKKDVVTALDLLGKGLDAALGALEKLSLAVVDVYAKVVDGAIKAAEAIANAIGVFLVLARDIAAGPLRWLKNLGSSIWNGIKNFLWDQLVLDVKEWGKAKLMEITGLAGVIFGAGMSLWEVLKQGGLDLAAIFKMAWPALLEGLKSALVETLIEKLVAMLVPAAAAVIAIVEGLKAAWSTVKRILAAFERFVDFLKSVKTGGDTAAKNFARVVSAAAVAVLDFVANWLLQKMKGVGTTIVAKLKVIAGKIWSKVKGAAKQVWAKVKTSKLGKKVKAWSDKRQARIAKESPEKKEKRLDRAMQDVDLLFRVGVTSEKIVRAALSIIKVKTGVTSLTLERKGEGSFEIVAQINPTKKYPHPVTTIAVYQIGSYGALATKAEHQRHHIIQDAWAKNRFGSMYDRNDAPCITLETGIGRERAQAEGMTGVATAVGTKHVATQALQRKLRDAMEKTTGDKWGATYRDHFDLARAALVAAEVNETAIVYSVARVRLHFTPIVGQFVKKEFNRGKEPGWTDV